MFLATLFTIFITSATILKSSYAANIKFYKNANQHEFQFEDSHLSTACTNVKEYYRWFGGSITSDSCVMAYNHRDCFMGSIKLLPGDTNLESSIQTSQGPLSFNIQSYRLCDDNDGGSSLHVDVYNNKTLKEVKRHERYPNVCGCQNLPEDLIEGVVTLDNHGNEMYVYTDHDCGGESKHIQAGENYDSEHPTYFRADHQTEEHYKYFETKFKQIKSIGPDPKSEYFSKSCVKLHGSLFKFQFLNDTNAKKPIRENVVLALEQTFINDGNAKITEEYSKSKKEKEVIEIEQSSSLELMARVEVETSVSVEAGISAPFLADAKVQMGLKTAVESTETVTRTKSKKTVVETERDFIIKKQIEVPPCQEYTVSSYVEKVRNAPFLYKGHLKIKGENGGNKMTAGEIKEHLKDDLVYERDLDEYTVEAVITGKMTAEYGIKSYMRGKGHKIAGCK